MSARLVVGADGRRTRVGELAQLEPEVLPHDRGGFFAYYEGVRSTAGDNAQFWILGEDVAYTFPTDDGLTALAILVNTRRLAEFKTDREGFLRRFYAALPDGPDLSGAQRVGDERRQRELRLDGSMLDLFDQIDRQVHVELLDLIITHSPMLAY